MKMLCDAAEHNHMRIRLMRLKHHRCAAFNAHYMMSRFNSMDRLANNRVEASNVVMRAMASVLFRYCAQKRSILGYCE